MHRFYSLRKWLLALLLLSSGTFAAPPSEFSVKPLMQELYRNLPYYLDYLAQVGGWSSPLDPLEQELLEGLRGYLRDNLPELDFSTLQNEFVLKMGEAERIAMTTGNSWSAIQINRALMAQKDYELSIPLTIQLLIHEVGHKLKRPADQAAIDSLATKAGTFFKAYTSSLALSDGWTMQVVSLPVSWFYWPPPQWGYLHQRLRPNTAVFLRHENQGFKTVTNDILNSATQTSGGLWATPAAGRVFSDRQIQLFGLDSSGTNETSLMVRDENQLQPEEAWRLRLDPELFQSAARNQVELGLRFDPSTASFTPRVGPARKHQFVDPVRSLLEPLNSQEYRLTLPDLKADSHSYLLVSTAQGSVQLAAEKNSDPPAFRWRVPQNSSNEFIDIQSVTDSEGNTRFLDRAYWFAAPHIDPSVRGPKASFMQMQVDTKWRNVRMTPEDAPGGENSEIYNRWGSVPYRIQLQRPGKIKQIRFIFSMTKKRNKASNLRQPVVQDILQNHLYARGTGDEYAYEAETYEETFSEDQIQQDERTLTVSLDMRPRHTSFADSRTYVSSFSIFHQFQSQVVIENLIGEDVGRRDLLDIQITNENFETESLTKGFKRPVFRFNGSGLSPCEQFMRNRQHYSNMFE
jgi:hypothetical protein